MSAVHGVDLTAVATAARHTGCVGQTATHVLASVGDAAKDADVWTERPTGFGARALLHWLAGDEPLAGARPR